MEMKLTRSAASWTSPRDVGLLMAEQVRTVHSHTLGILTNCKRHDAHTGRYERRNCPNAAGEEQLHSREEERTS